MKKVVKAPGTCGELVQGTIDDINFHITCPIDCYTKVSVELTNKKNFTINSFDKQKILKTVKKTMLYINNEIRGASITVDSDLHIAKGMASSTADMAAACFATASALGYDLSLTEMKNILLSIEPSDGLFFPGIVAFDHVRGNFFKKIGSNINLSIIVFDYGGVIDTIEFNKQNCLLEKNREKEAEVRKAYELVMKGFESNNPYLVAKGSSISAFANQNILEKPKLFEVYDEALRLGALGINIAHSGTLLGILGEKDKIDTELIVNRINELSDLSYLGTFKLISGGLISS